MKRQAQQETSSQEEAEAVIVAAMAPNTKLTITHSIFELEALNFAYFYTVFTMKCEFIVMDLFKSKFWGKNSQNMKVCILACV